MLTPQPAHAVSDHPLTHLLREATRKPVLNILEGAISHALLLGQRFGIVTSGSGYKYVHYTEVRNFLGAPSERFAGVVACDVAVLEFQGGARDVVERKVKAASAKSAAQGADVIILGCAGACVPLLSVCCPDPALCSRNGGDGAPRSSGCGRGWPWACTGSRRRQSRSTDPRRTREIRQRNMKMLTINAELKKATVSGKSKGV